MSDELEQYLERKAICIVEGVSEAVAVQVAWDQVKGRLQGKSVMPWLIFQDLKKFGIDQAG